MLDDLDGLDDDRDPPDDPDDQLSAAPTIPSLDDDRILALELVRATEAAAIASARFLGRGDDDEVDGAATDAMRPVLGTIQMRGVVVIGEGEKDESPMIYAGERIGAGRGPLVDIAVDPIDGAGLTAKGLPKAISVIALADRGSMYDPGPCVYMDKVVVGPSLVDVVDIKAPVEETVRAIARSRGEEAGDVTVALLDRPRHEDLARRIRATGARIMFLLDGDLVGALLALTDESEIDMALGIGGAPEGVIAACAVKCLGGAIYGKLAPRNPAEARQARDLGLRPDDVLTTDELVRGNNAYLVATGVTGSELLRGVRFSRDTAVTHSLSMRSSSGAVRTIETKHRLSTSTLVPPAADAT
jgi:fructose-1,6-bisphosphatase II